MDKSAPSRESLERKCDKLREVCGEAYQMAGALGAPVKALDNLSAAANGKPIPHKTFLPVCNERDEVTEKLAKALDFMYRYFVMPGHPERAKDCPNKDCPFCKADEALAAYRERMGR